MFEKLSLWIEFRYTYFWGKGRFKETDVIVRNLSTDSKLVFRMILSSRCACLVLMSLAIGVIYVES
jgi:hypothetical protein